MKTKYRVLVLTAIVSAGLLASPVWAEIFYVGSQAGHHVAEISSVGLVSMFANLPAGAVYSSGVAFDASGNLFAADPNKNTISKITPAGTASLFKTLPSGSFPECLAFDGGGNLYVANNTAHQINKIAPDGTLSLFATVPGSEGMAFDTSGNLYAAAGDQIKKVTPAGAVSLFATLPSGSHAFGLAFDGSGNLYAADFLTDKVSKINSLGVESTFATLPTNTQPTGLAFDGSGNLYVAGVNAPADVHKITPAGEVSVFATSAQESFLYIAVTDDAGHPFALPPTLPGDYNRNGVVDAADYTVWRDTLGSTTDLRANGDVTGASGGVVDQADYVVWKANFGNHSDSGGGASSNAAVPEPASLWLLVAGILSLCSRRCAKVS